MNMRQRLCGRHRNSVAEEGGRNLGRTWTKDGKRRQAGPLEGLQRLYTCPPGRSAVVSHPRGTCGSCSELGRLQVGESSWLLQEKSMPLSHPELIASPLPCPSAGLDPQKWIKTNSKMLSLLDVYGVSEVARQLPCFPARARDPHLVASDRDF